MPWRCPPQLAAGYGALRPLREQCPGWIQPPHEWGLAHVALTCLRSTHFEQAHCIFGANDAEMLRWAEWRPKIRGRPTSKKQALWVPRFFPSAGLRRELSRTLRAGT